MSAFGNQVDSAFPSTPSVVLTSVADLGLTEWGYLGVWRVWTPRQAEGIDMMDLRKVYLKAVYTSFFTNAFQIKGITHSKQLYFDIGPK